MPIRIEILDLNLMRSSLAAERVRSIAVDEGVECSVVPAAVVPAILTELRANAIPVYRINGCTVWEGEDLPEDLLLAWLHWPRSLDEAAEMILPFLKEGSGDDHFGLGLGIRNGYGLWGANRDLLRSCGQGKEVSADDASEMIIARAREMQQRRGDRS